LDVNLRNPHPADVGLKFDPMSDTKLSASRKFGPSPDSYVKNFF